MKKRLTHKEKLSKSKMYEKSQVSISKYVFRDSWNGNTTEFTPKEAQKIASLFNVPEAYNAKVLNNGVYEEVSIETGDIAVKEISFTVPTDILNKIIFIAEKSSLSRGTVVRDILVKYLNKE